MVLVIPIYPLNAMYFFQKCLNLFTIIDESDPVFTGSQHRGFRGSVYQSFEDGPTRFYIVWTEEYVSQVTVQFSMPYLGLGLEATRPYLAWLFS